MAAPQTAEQTTVRLLEILQQLSEELHPGQKAGQLRLDSSLDRDLGIDSLGRMELLRRLERHFDISLNEQQFSNAETARDLLRVILQADTGRKLDPIEQLTELKFSTNATEPDQAKTLPQVLDWHLQQPDQPHIHFYTDQGPVPSLSYRQLHQGALKLAGGLQQRDLEPGTPVAIMLPSDANYFYAFWGILLAGAIPVPIYPPTRKSQLEDHLKRQRVILANCGASFLISMPEALNFARLLKSSLPQLQAVLTVAELQSNSTADFVAPAQQATDTAFLQYTSGSTGNPKGVILSHHNLLTNIRAMGRAVDASASDIIVSWLPLYHDMGLIGCWLSSLYYGSPLVLMSPLDFLNRPVRWLQAIHRYRGTLSPAPNFAYEICLSRLDDEELLGLDLSSWRCAFNGAEAISPTSVERFSQRFSSYGFRREALMPVYGLAENSVGLAFPPLGRGPLIDHIERETFVSNGQAKPVPANRANALRFVACGQPISGHEIRVVDQRGYELPERQQGRVQFRGPSSCSGYFRNQAATTKLFVDDWLDSGDLGYICAGEIYITGRAKDLIIIAGRNIYPQELEEAVAELDGIRKGNVVVFGYTDPARGSEKLVILAETREQNPEQQEVLRQRINKQALQLVGLPPHDLLLLPAKTIPKTSSGKLRRAATRDLYLKGQLNRSQQQWRQNLELLWLGICGLKQRTRQSLVKQAVTLWSWTLFYLLVPPVYLGIALLPKIDLRLAFIRRVLRLLTRLSGTQLQVEGLEQLPQGPCVLVANHASYLDSYALLAALPGRFSFVAKRELAENAFLRWPLQRIGTQFVERFDKQQGLADARKLGQKIQAGDSLLFFPEGTFTRIPGLRSFYMGAFVAASEADLPLVPIAIRGTRSILRGKDKRVHRGSIQIQIGSAHKGSELATNTEDAWLRALKLRDYSRDYILHHCGEPDLDQH